MSNRLLEQYRDFSNDNGVPYRKEIYARLQAMYDAMANSDPAHARFTVNNPPILTEKALIRIGEDYIRSMRGILAELNMLEILSQNIAVRVMKGECPQIARIDDYGQRIYNIPVGEEYKGSTENAIFDIKTWFLGEFDIDDDVYDLGESLSEMFESDYQGVVNYFVWPMVCSKLPSLLDPYKADFHLWKHNAKAVFADDKTLHIYVENYE